MQTFTAHQITALLLILIFICELDLAQDVSGQDQLLMKLPLGERNL